jgi:molybdopterin synthase catalytic subunit
MIEITSQPLDVDHVLRSVRDERCGAALLFLGTTRAWTGERQTVSLEYESYQAMALRQIRELVDEARGRWDIVGCSVVHRVGPVAVGEPSIAIAVSSPHRADAFAAGQWLIDSIKADVAIWKKERWADGAEEWQHPPSGEGSRQRLGAP